MQMRQLFDQDTSTYTYLLWDPETREAVLIDPVDTQVARDLTLLDELGLKLTHTLDTHVHADHVTGAGMLRERTGSKTVASKAGAECADLHVGDGDTIPLGSQRIHVLETPGHTDDSLSYRIDGEVFTGDALLVRGTGRTDFQNGSPEDLYRSITDKLFGLPEATRVWPGHDYRGHTVSSIGEEKRSNPRVAGKSLAEFKVIMDNLNLPRPKYLDKAVPANRECGMGMAESEHHEAGFLDLPANEALAYAKKRDAAIIDVREPHEFVGEHGHLPGSVNIPQHEIAQAALDWDFDKPLLFVCRSGRRSRGVCNQLVKRGFRDVVNLRGGMLDFRD